MPRLLFLFIALTVALRADICWQVTTPGGTYYYSGSFSIPSSTPYTVSCWDDQGVSVTLYKDGNYVSAPYQGSDAGPKTVNFYAESNGYGYIYESSEGGYWYWGSISYSSDFSFTINAQPPNQAPFGCIDAPTASTAAFSQPLTVSGWAADPEMGAPVTRVILFMDNVEVADASRGQSRGDVASAYGRGDFQNSGWSATLNLSGWSFGVHTLTVIAVDDQGATTVIGSRNLTIMDDAPPSVPGGLSVTGNTSGSSFTLTWNASTDNVAVTGYEVACNGGSQGTTGGTAMGIGGLTQMTTYSMTVRACDTAGNWSGWSSPLAVTTPSATTGAIPNSVRALLQPDTSRPIAPDNSGTLKVHKP